MMRFNDFSEVFPKGVELSESTITTLKNAKRAYTFDEITLSDQPVEFHPNEVKTDSFITRKISLKSAGILSAAMDTVTGKHMAKAMAQCGGIGIIHRNMSAAEQAAQVSWVRRQIHFGGMIESPVTYLPTLHYSDLQRDIIENNHQFDAFPVCDEKGKLLGLIDRQCLEFVEDTNPTLASLMTSVDKIIVAQDPVETEDAYRIMKEHKIKKLPVLAAEGIMVGIYIWNDVKRTAGQKPRFGIDNEGHFIVGAAVGVGDEELKRVQALLDVGCKVVVLDASHGSNQAVKAQLSRVRQLGGVDLQIIVGNVASYRSAMFLLDGDAKPDALKVGIGAGATGTTRTGTGHGVPQVSAIYDVWRATRDYGERTGYHVPVIADGGIRTSGDIVKALACGASAVMVGRLLAGCEESPGTVVMKGGRRYKKIRGMGSGAAKLARESLSEAQRALADNKAAADLGVTGLVLAKGSCATVIQQLVGGLQSGLAHSGAKSIGAFQAKAEIWLQSFAGAAEGKPHDISDVHD